ncbi:MAG TPA: inositol-3-phosphate synthase [Polyangiaceae bacterium]|jgi:myo-inositol-1-phosphate synthase|nr:inositol-3-phosphate synthase [Polyangiaceae bacterium]
MKRLGVLIIGAHGAVASTLFAGVQLMLRGLAPRLGMLTEKAPRVESIADWLDVAPLEGLVFGGWDPTFKNAYEAAQQHRVLPVDRLLSVREKLEAISAWPAIGAKGNANNGRFVTANGHRAEVAAIQRNVEEFKRLNFVDQVVIVNLASTEPYLEECDVHGSLAAFERGLDESDPRINPAMRYFYAANLLGAPYCNFTPSLTNVAALREHAETLNNPFAGMDGKTGQTLLKTALAPMFRVRRLHIEGWYSTNILGNNDGRVLAEPESNKTKVLSKASVLDSIVGYPVENHQVHIHYYKPRGDSKEAWDNIDLVGFAGIPMQMKVNFLCQDSALAAPIVIDLVRLLDVAKRQGEKGIQRQLSLFFKSPYTEPGTTPVHDLFKQEQLLVDWARRSSARVADEHR